MPHKPKRWKKFARVAGILILLALIYHFFVGALFAYNPWKETLGFNVIRSEKAELVIDDLSKLPKNYKQVDQYVRDIETMYNLPANSPITVLVATSENQFDRFIPPWMNAEPLGGVAVGGTVLILNLEKLRLENERQPTFKFDVTQYLKHELVHNLQMQQIPLLTKIHIFGSGKDTWLNEGIGLYYGGPQFYSNTEFRTWLRQQIDNKTVDVFTKRPVAADFFNQLARADIDIKRKYSFYQYFIAYLRDTYGVDAFNTFLAQYNKEPEAWTSHFKSAFGQTLPDVVTQFLGTNLE